MKKTLAAIICATIATSVFLPQNSMARIKKNDPDKKEVEALLKEIGEKHYVERMKIKSFCTLEFEDASGEDNYFHIFKATMKGGGYRIIVYNNVPEYLGFYPSEFEPAEYEKDRIGLDSGESDADGNTEYHWLPLTIKGPAAKIRIASTPVSFVKNPKLEVAKSAAATTGGIPVVPKEKSVSGEVIDYRDWKITMKGREITVNAKFEKVEGGKVYIKNAKNGKVAGVPGSALSADDQEYVKRITAK